RFRNQRYVPDDPWCFCSMRLGYGSQSASLFSNTGLRKSTYLALASLTFTRGLARSSRNRWLCSSSRLSLSSDIDCLPPPRVLMMIQKGVGGRAKGILVVLGRVEVVGTAMWV